MNVQIDSIAALVGIGSYSVPEAARLIHARPVNLRRWMGGYNFRSADNQRRMPPLWTPQIPTANGSDIELGFRDLIELRFVHAFTKAGVGLNAIRRCIETARDLVGNDRPLSSRRFRTDGRTIFLESLEKAGDERLLDLRGGQFTFKQLVERTFKDLDLEDDVVARWRPYRGKNSIVIDPARAFGQPIAADAGVPTVALADAVEAEGSETEVARLFEVDVGVVRDAVLFEQSLRLS